MVWGWGRSASPLAIQEQENDMKNEDSEVSAMLATMRELCQQPALNSSEKLLGRIIVRTMMMVSEPNMLTKDELDMMGVFTEKIGLTPNDLVRMAASIMADNLIRKIEDVGGPGVFFNRE